MIAEWIIILALVGRCGNYNCADTVAVSQIGTFQSREACLTAANLALKNFSTSGVRAQAVCVPLK